MPSCRSFGTATVACVLVWGTHAHALGKAEKSLLDQSLRASERSAVETALGPEGLAGLTFVAVDVTLDDTARTVSGTTRIEWTNRTGRALLVVPLRMSANGEARGKEPLLEFGDVRVGVGEGALGPAVPRAVSPSVIEVPLPQPLAPGGRVVFVVELSGKLPFITADQLDPVNGLQAFPGMGGDDEDGKAAPVAGGEQYGTFACGAAICTLTGFVPEVPAFIDGAFDVGGGSGIGDATYSEPVNALVSVVHDSRVTLAATGREVGKVPEKGGKTRSTFALAAGRELGLVASRKFVVATREVAGVTVRSVSLATHKAGGKRALEAAVSALKTFDGSLGAYPWSTLDIAEAALTGGAGGVELPSLALGGTTFYGPAGGAMAMLGDRMQEEILEFVTRHEVAHQWWHAQVGSHAQRHPFLDEPLAQYSALLATRAHKGSLAERRARDTQVAINFQSLGLMGLEDGPVARPAGTFSSPLQYAALVYGKAPLFYEALAKEVGEEAVLKALRTYVTSFRFKRASPDDLRNALRSSSGGRGERVDALWVRWMEEAHGEEDVGALDLEALMAGMFSAPGASAGSAKGGKAAGRTGRGGGLLGGLGGGGGASEKELAEAMKLLQGLFQGINSREFRELMKEMQESGGMGGAGSGANDEDEGAAGTEDEE